MPEITVDAISKSYGDEPALSDVSFTVHDGELLTLLGPSGCGKTTTLMSIAGFQQPDAGRIACGGRPFFDHAARLYIPAEGRDLGLVFQSYAVWPHLTVAQNVGFPLKVRKVGRSDRATRVRETLELVEMGAYAARYPHELSGGQQQRVALARALVYSPAVLLLDEPFSNLDAKLRERARTWLKRLQTELALTTVFVTHDQDEALSMSDRVLVMDRGRILQDGTPEEVYARPSSRFVAEFLGRCNIATGRPITPAASGATHLPRLAVGPGSMPLELSRNVPATGSGSVEVAIRPEAIELSEQAPGGGNVFAAQVRSVSFLGDHYLYELDAGGMPLMATSPRRFAGTLLWARIPPEACWILGRDELRPAPTHRTEQGVTHA
jgi:iron(III) transport system ATP-binding protein